MKNLKSFNQLHEKTKPKKKFFPADDNEPLFREITDIVDELDSDDAINSLDGPEWNKEFEKALVKNDYEVFTGSKLKNFELEEMDAVFGPEDYPGDLFYAFNDGMLVQVSGTGLSYTVSWEDFLNNYEHDYKSVLVARKNGPNEKLDSMTIQNKADELNLYGEMAKRGDIGELASKLSSIRDFPDEHQMTFKDAEIILKKYHKYDEVMTMLDSEEEFVDPAGGSGLHSHENLKTFESFSVEEGRRTLEDLRAEEKELEQEREQVDTDMNQDPKLIANNDDPVAQEWGNQLNAIDIKLEKIRAQIANALKFQKPRGPGKNKQTDAYLKLKKNQDDVLRSKKAFPTRTKEEAALILKKRYNIRDNSWTVADELTKLGLYEGEINEETIRGPRGLSINIQYDYLTLKTPSGNYTSSRNGAKCTGQLAAIPGAFKAIDAYVEGEVKKKRVYGDIFKDLLKPELMDQLVPGWDKPKSVDVDAGDTIKFSEPSFAKKYPGEYEVYKSVKKYAYIKIPKKGSTTEFDNIGFEKYTMEVTKKKKQ